MIAVASSRGKMVAAEENRGRRADQVGLVIDVMRTVRLACTTVVHLVPVQINQDLVKSLAKKDPVKVLIAQAKVKIGDPVAKPGLNLVKNSLKASQNRGILGDFPWQF